MDKLLSVVRLFRSDLKDIISSNTFLVGMSFLTGLILGYFLGLAKIHQSLLRISPKISLDSPWWLDRVIQATPSPTFLSDVAAFEAVIIAFLVPLSIEIISRISERYNSDVITRSFNNIWEIKFLPPFLLTNIVMVIVLRFFVEDDANSPMWRIFAWIILLMFVFIAIVVLRTIKQIKTFVGDTRSIVNRLHQDVEKSIE